nr:hypothetical protein [Paraburkholderia caribensis]
MDSVDGSLRVLVEKWLGPAPGTRVRVIEFGRLRSSRRRYVCVEASRPAGALVIYFFHHDGGMWRVFPPAPDRPAMNALRRATC